MTDIDDDIDEFRPYNAWLTAHHEAGHAVAAVVLGLDLWEVRLFEEGESEHSFGHVAINVPASDLDEWTEEQRRDQCAMAWMGFLVHQRLEVEEPMLGCQQDLDDVTMYAGFASFPEAAESLTSGDPRAALIRSASSRAAVILHAFWPAIEAVAQALVARGMLDAEEVHMIVTAHDNGITKATLAYLQLGRV